jgi:hypothetical protein
MQAPASLGAGSTFISPLTQISYTIDAAGFVTVNALLDIIGLGAQGFKQLPGGRNNYTASADPAAVNDGTQDYDSGSLWLNTTASPARAWVCVSAATSAAVWLQVSTGALIATANSPSFANLTLSGRQTRSSATAVTAFSGGGQASATSLSADFSNITTATASSPPYDSAKFSAVGAPGQDRPIANNAANPVQLFGSGSDTINGVASGTGVTLLPGFIGVAKCVVAGNLQIDNLPSFATADKYNANSATSGTTLTGANLTGGATEVTLAMTGTLGGDANAQLPTVANLVAAIPNPVAGYSYKVRFLNLSSANHVWTITTNTGWTLNGTMTVAQNASRACYVTLTTLSAAVLQSIDA